MSLTQMQLEDKGKQMSDSDKRYAAESITACLVGLLSSAVSNMSLTDATLILMHLNSILYTKGYKAQHAQWAAESEKRIITLQQKHKQHDTI